MNEQLIKFIELCLMDGVVTDKEREVIFRKSKELGVPEDECEIILEGMIQQKVGEVQSKEVSLQTNVPVSNSFEEKKPKLLKREDLRSSEIEKKLTSLNEEIDVLFEEIDKTQLLKQELVSFIRSRIDNDVLQELKRNNYKLNFLDEN